MRLSSNSGRRCEATPFLTMARSPDQPTRASRPRHRRKAAESPRCDCTGSTTVATAVGIGHGRSRPGSRMGQSPWPPSAAHEASRPRRNTRRSAVRRSGARSPSLDHRIVHLAASPSRMAGNGCASSPALLCCLSLREDSAPAKFNRLAAAARDVRPATSVVTVISR